MNEGQCFRSMAEQLGDFLDNVFFSFSRAAFKALEHLASRLSLISTVSRDHLHAYRMRIKGRNKQDRAPPELHIQRATAFHRKRWGLTFSSFLSTSTNFLTTALAAGLEAPRAGPGARFLVLAGAR